jgi:hypothetical protein
MERLAKIRSSIDTYTASIREIIIIKKVLQCLDCAFSSAVPTPGTPKYITILVCENKSKP